jgi:predicted dehydrogenase
MLRPRSLFPMASKRIVLVGAGMRARDFVASIALQHSASSRLVGICDTSPQRMAFLNTSLANDWQAERVPVAAPDGFERLIKGQGANTVLVATTDGVHHEYICRALRCGCDVITEKPMTIDAPRCRSILTEAAAGPGKVQVAFNYRWQAHRTAVRDLIASGRIGAVKSVNLEYLLDTDHGADYFRRWHANREQSGGLLVHKSTHHFDLVNWWLDAIPSQVFAYGDLAFYGRDNALRRGDAPYTRYPRYTGAETNGDPYRFSLRDGGLLEGLYYRAEADSGYLRDRNVFRDDIDIPDVMSVVARFRTGQQLTYSLVCFSPREGMRVTFNGDRGRIEYYEFVRAPVRGRMEKTVAAAEDPAEISIRVFPHFSEAYDFPVSVGTGGHLGADPLLMEQLFAESPPADEHGRVAGPEQGAASILVGIAANESILTGRPVNVLDLAPLRPEALKLSELR